MSYLSDYLFQYFDEVSCKRFYRDVFPVGSFEQRECLKKESIMEFWLKLQMRN